MERLEVHKFGGTSVADSQHINAVARLILENNRRAKIVVVSSATSGTTDRLIKLGTLAAQGEMAKVATLIDELERRHLSIFRDLGGGNEEVEAAIEELVDVVRRLTGAVGIHRELTPRVYDRIVITGEKIAVRLIAMALRRVGMAAQACDADEFLETDGRFGHASALPGVADRAIEKALGPLLDKGIIPVVTGFCGRAPDGATTTLGRGGSDLSATLIAAALSADEVTIWTDVDGVMSANPKVVPDAQVIAHLNYREAAEMSFYGAKVLHQRTMVPVAARNIPVRTRNTENPSAQGTLVDQRVIPGSFSVKAVSAIPGHALLSVEGKGMAGVPGFSARVFDVMAKENLSVTMYSQSSSESSICLAVPSERAERALTALEEEFQRELDGGVLESISVRPDVGLVAVVGLGMAHTPGVAGCATGSLGQAGVNILAIAQGSSELNITLAVEEADLDRGLKALHRSFGLNKIDTGALTPDRLDLILLGTGDLGRSLARLIIEHRGEIKERFGLDARIVTIADENGFVLETGGFEPDPMLDLLEELNEGVSPADLPGGESGSSVDALRAALSYHLSRPILVDTSAERNSDEIFGEAFQQSCDVVTTSKTSFTTNLSMMSGLLDTIRRERCRAIPMVVTTAATIEAPKASDVLECVQNILEKRRATE